MALISKKISLRVRTSNSNRLYPGFAPTASDEDLVAFATAINSAQEHPLTEIRKIDDELHGVSG